MPQTNTASLASAVLAGVLVLLAWTTTVSMPAAHAAPAPVPAHVILA